MRKQIKLSLLLLPLLLITACTTSNVDTNVGLTSAQEHEAYDCSALSRQMSAVRNSNANTATSAEQQYRDLRDIYESQGCGK